MRFNIQMAHTYRTKRAVTIAFWAVSDDRYSHLPWFIAVYISVTFIVYAFGEVRRNCAKITTWSGLQALVNSVEGLVVKHDAAKPVLYCKILDAFELIEVVDMELSDEQALENTTVLQHEKRLLEFLREEVKLESVARAARRYTPETMAMAQDLHARAPAGYRAIRELLNLPSKSTSSKNALPFRSETGVDPNRLVLLAELTKSLKGYQRICAIQFDEVYNERKIEYKNGKVRWRGY